jgi:hypothetical protein
MERLMPLNRGVDWMCRAAAGVAFHHVGWRWATVSFATGTVGPLGASAFRERGLVGIR